MTVHPPGQHPAPGPQRPPGPPYQPPAPAAYPPAPFGPPGYPVAGPPVPPRRPSRAGFVLATLGAAAAALLLGAVVGGVTGLVTTEPPGSEAAPPFAAEFPSDDRQYMTGVTVTLIADDWLKKANSWSCADLRAGHPTHSQARQVMECRPRGDGRDDMYVRIEYDAVDKVKLVEATCHAGVDSDACKTLFATMADALLTPQPGLREQAGKWAKENAGSERVTTVGGIRLAANLQPNGMQATPGV